MKQVLSLINKGSLGLWFALLVLAWISPQFPYWLRKVLELLAIGLLWLKMIELLGRRRNPLPVAEYDSQLVSWPTACVGASVISMFYFAWSAQYEAYGAPTTLAATSLILTSSMRVRSDRPT